MEERTDTIMTETRMGHPEGGLSEGSPEKNPVSFIQDNRKAVVDQLILLIEEGNTFYSPRWSSSAMRPRNPISGALYHGSSRQRMDPVYFFVTGTEDNINGNWNQRF